MDMDIEISAVQDGQHWRAVLRVHTPIGTIEQWDKVTHANEVEALKYAEEIYTADDGVKLGYKFMNDTAQGFPGVGESEANQ